MPVKMVNLINEIDDLSQLINSMFYRKQKELKQILRYTHFEFSTLIANVKISSKTAYLRSHCLWHKEYFFNTPFPIPE